MIDLDTILVPTDFSEHSVLALDFARALARTHEAAIAVTHTCRGADDLPAARDRLAGLATSLGSLANRALVGVGRPEDLLVEAARESKKALIVMATRGRRGLRRRLDFRHSVAERVVSRAPCPILTVKREDGQFLSDGRPPELPRILVPLDFSALSLKALRYATELARVYGSELVLLHVLPKREENRHQRARRTWVLSYLDQIGRRVHPVPRTTLVVAGPRGRSIALVAVAKKASLVVMGTRGLRVVAGVPQRSIARGVVRWAPCPVLVVKAQQAEIVYPPDLGHGFEPPPRAR